MFIYDCSFYWSALLFAPLSGIEAQAAPAAAAQAAYVSELTGLPTSIALQTQRPVAVMIDNDTKALPHYGLSEADVVYEMMNSTANKRVTRLMAIYKVGRMLVRSAMSVPQDRRIFCLLRNGMQF